MSTFKKEVSVTTSFDVMVLTFSYSSDLCVSRFYWIAV